MKVFILHQYFNTPASGGPLRSYYLARALVEAGISTVVITTHNHSTAQTKYLEGIEIHYLPIPYDNRFGFLKRISSFLKFVWSIVREAGKFQDADVCYAISTPLTIGLAAMWIKKRYHIPYYFEVGDLWPEAPIQMGIIKNPLLKAFLYKLEKSIYKRANAIVALSEAIKTNVAQKISGKEIHVIPNMADTDFYKPELKRPEFEEKFEAKGKFVVSYIGTLGIANGLAVLLDYSRLCLQHNLPVHFLICGDGAERERLQQAAKKLQLTNITFVPFQNREGVRAVLNVTDAVLVSFKSIPVLQTGSPNKYFDGLAAGKLMVINVGGWMKDELEDHRCGVFIEYYNPEDIIDKLKPFIENPESLTRSQQEARKLAEDKYSRKILSDQFLKLFVSR